MRGEEKIEELKLQTLNLMPERYQQLYDKPHTVSIFGNEPELPINDPDQLNAYFDNLNKTRYISGAAVDRLAGAASGPSRRV